jgi:hypothetical protein
MGSRIGDSISRTTRSPSGVTLNSGRISAQARSNLTDSKRFIYDIRNSGNKDCYNLISIRNSLHELKNNGSDGCRKYHYLELVSGSHLCASWISRLRHYWVQIPLTLFFCGFTCVWVFWVRGHKSHIDVHNHQSIKRQRLLSPATPNTPKGTHAWPAVYLTICHESQCYSLAVWLKLKISHFLFMLS